MASYGGDQPNGCLFNGLLPNKEASETRGLDMERWMRAEDRTAELIARIQPDKQSWEKRSAIASYIQRLITQCISCVVFLYGSVPLKTYLPDGDIDLTIFSEYHHLNGNFAAEVRDMLEKEKKNEYAEHRIKEVKLINAEVKVVKCIVDNIVVDISFGQLGGLCTLCFLEQVDQHIKQDHLFKRSIILIKAWCYYESRLLGAYYGLLSTYALETLILYIFHLFNNSFAGPLEVLYRFLEFFSHFDWDNFCISLQGPVPIRSLPNMTADPPRKDGGALYLSSTFLDICSFYYSVRPSTHEIKEQFVPKHFNIIDFIRTNNNLGRSVRRGNFFRIRSAFAFGAQRLARLMDCPKENVVTELNQFFFNTWDVNGKALYPDTHNGHEYGFVNRYQMENGEEVYDPDFWVYGTGSSTKHNPEDGLFCTEYMERTQIPAPAYCHPENRYQYGPLMENRDLIVGGKDFSRSSFTNSLKVSSGNSKDGLPLMCGDTLDERVWKACTMDHKPVIDYTQCQSRADVVFKQSSHKVNGGKNCIPFSINETALRYNHQSEGKGPTLDTYGSVYWTDYDILSGDMANHLSNMMYARSCQISPFNGPHFCRPSIVPSQYLDQQFMSGNPGKLSSPAVNYAVLPETAVMPSSRHHSNEASLAGGYQRYPRGAHVSNLRSCGDFQSSSSRNQKGNYHYQKEQHGEGEVNSNFNSGPRFAGHPHQWENPNSRPYCSAARDDRGHMQWKALRKQPSLRRAQGSAII